MKNTIALIALLAFSQTTLAEKISGENVVQIDACSSYIFASREKHAESAVNNYREKASAACLELGYTEWETLQRSVSPGLLNVPVRCISGIVECK